MKCLFVTKEENFLFTLETVVHLTSFGVQITVMKMKQCVQIALVPLDTGRAQLGFVFTATRYVTVKKNMKTVQMNYTVIYRSVPKATLNVLISKPA